MTEPVPRYFTTRRDPRPDDPTESVWRTAGGETHLIQRGFPKWVRSYCQLDDFVGPGGRLRRDTKEVKCPYAYLGIEPVESEVPHD